ncbi:hypothetical protein ACQR2L_09720 [Clostridium butyricum]|uniref:hypothetical protein n=1 Tax=Clostridium butyricum TaxID=1492 RepID=UPI003D0EB8AB
MEQVRIHSMILRERIKELKFSIYMICIEDDKELIELDKKDIKEHFRMVKLQMDRLKKKIDNLERVE